MARGLSCGLKQFANKPEYTGTVDVYQTAPTHEPTSRGFDEDIEDRTDGVTGLLQLPVSENRDMREARSTEGNERVTRKLTSVMDSASSYAKTEELPPKSRIKEDSGYIETSRSSPFVGIKVKIEDLDASSEYGDNGDMTKPSRKKARLFKGENGVTDVAHWKAVVKNNPIDYRNWDRLIAIYQGEFTEMTAREASTSHQGINTSIS